MMPIEERDSMLDRFPGWAVPAAIFVVALALRIWFLIQFSHAPLFETDIMDMAYFRRLATEGIPGSGFPTGVFFKAPLYPLFLKLVFGLFGDGSWPVRITQGVLGSLTAAMTCLIADRLSGRRAALIAGLIVSGCGTLILYDGQLLVPTLAIFLNTAAIYVLIRSFEAHQTGLFALGGFILGLSALARPTILVFALGVAILVYLQDRREPRGSRLRNSIFLLAGLIIAIAPVTVRNYLQSGEFVPIASYAGINLYIGNNLKADGVSTTIPGTGLEWWNNASMSDTRAIAAAEAGRPLSAGEESDFWRNRAIQEMLTHPGFFVRLVGRKLLLTIGGYELANNFDIYYLARRTPLLSFLIWRGPVYSPWGLLLPFGLAGMLLVRRRDARSRLLALFLVAALPGLLLFFVTARYRLPLVPVLAVFAAVGLDRFLDGLNGLNKRRLWLATAVLIVLLVAGQLDPFGYASGSEAQGHQMYASIYSRQRNTVEAEKYYRLALQDDPMLPHANNDLGLLLQERGEFEQAEVLHRRAVKAQPDDWILRYNLGLALKGQGRYEEALSFLSRAVTAAPDFVEATDELAFALLQAGYLDSAATIYGRATDLDPENANAWFARGLCFHLLEQRDSAEAFYRQAVTVDTGLGKAYYNLGRLYIEERQVDSARAYLSRSIELAPESDNLRRTAIRLIDSLDRSSR